MKQKAGQKERENSIWALGYTLAVFVILALCFDFYYDLNDDMLIKDITSGIYSGRPSGFNVQMHFPLSFAISLFYKVLGNVPWYGIYIVGMQFLCLYLLTKRILTFFESRVGKSVVLLIESGVFVLLLLWEFLFTQYTVTSALLASTALFLMYTGEKADDTKAFLKQNIGNILLVILSFLTRSEMLLMMLPFICIAGVCKWATETKIFTGKNMIKYFSLFGIILAGLLCCQILHMLAYGSSEWKQFYRFFDARTEFYDFHKIPPYYENEEFYQSMGMDENDWHIMIEWYNFGMDESFQAGQMEELANYAKQIDAGKTTLKETLKNAFIEYRYRTFYATDYPYNMIIIAMYILVLTVALVNKHYRFLFTLPFMGVVRSMVWLYMQSRQRMPERITHSLYLAEFFLLLAMLLTECAQQKKEKPKIFYCSLLASIGSILCLFIIWHGGKSINAVQKEFERREEISNEYKTLTEYVKNHPECFYVTDVFSTVKYSSKIKEDTDNRVLNMDICGGWFNKSPLMKQKLQYFGLSDMENDLIKNPDVLFLIKDDGEYVDNMITWLEKNYQKKGHIVSFKKVDSILSEEKEIFRVYQVMGE